MHLKTCKYKVKHLETRNVGLASGGGCLRKEKARKGIVENEMHMNSHLWLQLKDQRDSLDRWLSLAGSRSGEVVLPPGLVLVHSCWVLCSFWVSTFQKAPRKLAKCCGRDTRMIRVLRNCPMECVRVVSFRLSPEG